MSKYSHIWDKSKDGSYQQQRSFLRYVIIATVLFAVFLFVKKGNVIRWAQAGMTLRKQRHQIELYQQKIDAIDKEIHILNTDVDTLEKFAREKFRFAEPGDDVYILEEQ